MRMPKCSGIPERAGVEVIADHQFAAKQRTILQQCEPARVIDMSLTAALIGHVNDFGPVRQHLSQFPPTDAFLTIDL
jgi:hypothetical protein